MADLVTTRDWLTVFRLPPYAHELNPVESVWSLLKRSLANLAKRDISQLTALVKTQLRRMQYRPGLLDGFLAGIRLDLTPFRNLRNGRSRTSGGPGSPSSSASRLGSSAAAGPSCAAPSMSSPCRLSAIIKTGQVRRYVTRFVRSA
jgi:DDE superfamily endonuclease